MAMLRTQMLGTIFFCSIFSTSFAQGISANPYAPYTPSPPSTPGLSLQEMEALAERLIKKSERQSPEMKSYWNSNPTLGVFSSNGKTAYVLHLNGERLDLRECEDVESLKSMVIKNFHRNITGNPLPSGYLALHPENIEEIARNASCSLGARLKNFISK
jgi:hypothetical protein